MPSGPFTAGASTSRESSSHADALIGEQLVGMHQQFRPLHQAAIRAGDLLDLVGTLSVLRTALHPLRPGLS